MKRIKITIGHYMMKLKKNITLCLIDLMDQGMACKPDATNLYTIVLRIYPNGLGTNRIENKVKFDNIKNQYHGFRSK
jgi:hypothetical protein